MSFYVRVFVCVTHGELIADPWDGGYLYDFDATRYKCAVGSRSCAFELICAAKSHGDGAWFISTDSECDKWTHIDDPRWSTKCRIQNNLDLKRVRSQLEELRATARPCVVCNDRMLTHTGADVCFDCWTMRL